MNDERYTWNYREQEETDNQYRQENENRVAKVFLLKVLLMFLVSLILLEVVIYQTRLPVLSLEEVESEIQPLTVRITCESFLSSSNGSGFSLGEGYYLTCAHVVDNYNKISLTTPDGQSGTATIIGLDENNDLALLYSENLKLNGLTFADSLETDEFVYALGNPYTSDYGFTISYGYVTAVETTIASGTNQELKMTEFDAPVYPGNSGGALINQYGEVVGVVSKRQGSGDRLGYAVSLSDIKAFVEEYIN